MCQCGAGAYRTDAAAELVLRRGTLRALLGAHSQGARCAGEARAPPHRRGAAPRRTSAGKAPASAHDELAGLACTTELAGRTLARPRRAPAPRRRRSSSKPTGAPLAAVASRRQRAASLRGGANLPPTCAQESRAQGTTGPP